MEGNNTSRNIKDISLRGGAIVAKLLGVVNPAAATVGIIAECIRERRSERFARRLESLLQTLENRVQHLEIQSQNEPNLDLLDEIVAKAVSEEDEDKTKYYAALIEYYASHSLEAYEIRLLGNALKALTVYEISSFVSFASGQNYLRDIPEDLKNVFWIRVEFLGLFKGGTVKHVSQISQLGKKFVDVCNLATEAR